MQDLIDPPMATFISQFHLQPDTNTNTNTEMWPTQVDPRLLSTSSSELAAALAPSSHPSATSSVSTPSSSLPLPGSHSQSHNISPVLVSGPSSQINPSPVSASIQGQLVMSTSTPVNTTASVPARYCSVKGCKAIIPNGYFYKMCESCRER